MLVDPSSIDPTMRSYLDGIGGGVTLAFAYGGGASLPSASVTALSSALAGA
ncbi:MAG: hypothetical protein ACHQNA_03770 [Acidimicrobiales bacterium]